MLRNTNIFEIYLFSVLNSHTYRKRLKTEGKSTTSQFEGGQERGGLKTLITQLDNHPQKCTPECSPR